MEIIDEKVISKRISKDIGMPYEQVVSIYRSCIAYLVHVMKHSGFEPVKLPYLGKFMVKPYRLQAYNERKIKRKNELIQIRG